MRVLGVGSHVPSIPFSISHQRNEARGGENDDWSSNDSCCSRLCVVVIVVVVNIVVVDVAVTVAAAVAVVAAASLYVCRAAGRAAVPGQLVRHGACSIRCSLK